MDRQLDEQMDGWQGEKEEDKRDMLSDPGSSQPICGQRTRDRTIGGEFRDTGQPQGS